jgi:cytochrome bd-type quinol oxidase subunit 1
LAAWLATIEGARLATGNALYRRVFDFWLKVFAVSFGMGVVTGIRAARVGLGSCWERTRTAINRRSLLTCVFFSLPS